MIVGRVVLIILAVVLLSGCNRDTENTEPTRKGVEERTARPPAISDAVIIGPVDATRQSIISLRADGAILSGGRVYWYVNGEEVEHVKGVQFSSDELVKGDVVQALIVKDGKEFYSNELVIKNTPPVILSAKILPEVPVVASSLSVAAKAEDIDGDHVLFHYKWYINDALVSENSSLDTELRRDDRIAVEVTPYDGDEPGRGVTLKTRVFNTPPLISESKPEFDGKFYRFQIKVSDPDGDPLTFKLTKAPEGMKIDEKSGLVTWPVGLDITGTFPVQVTVTDGHGGKSTYDFKVAIKVEAAK